MFTNTKEHIDSAIYANDKGEVTAENLNSVLHDICDSAEDGIVNLKVNKQDTLISGKNIKTINNQDITGKGNLELNYPVDNEMSSTSTNPVQNLVVKEYIDNIEDKNKGYYSSVDILTAQHPNPRPGSRAYVGTTYPYKIYTWDSNSNQWVDTLEVGGNENVPLGEYYTRNTSDAYFVSKEQIKDYSTTEQVKEIVKDEYTIMTIEEFEQLAVKENKLYFCTE